MVERAPFEFSVLEGFKSKSGLIIFGGGPCVQHLDAVSRRQDLVRGPHSPCPWVSAFALSLSLLLCVLSVCNKSEHNYGQEV